MTDFALTALLLTGAVAAALWAGLLALAEESPQMVPSLGLAPAGWENPPLHRALYLGRTVLLFLAGALVALTVVWWQRPLAAGLGIVLIATAFLYVVADALPRAAGMLAPDLSRTAALVARRSLIPFRPLFGLVGIFERWVVEWLPGRQGGGGLAAAQRDMLLGIFSLGDTTVADIMTPRLDLAAVESRST